MNFQHVITRIPCKKVTEGQTTANLGKPDYKKALIQHECYRKALSECGVTVTVLEPLEDYPDSCFVEDPAIVTEKTAIILYPGAATRQGEEKEILPALQSFYPTIEAVTTGTIEGGDVMRIGNHFYIGLSKRTNQTGADCLGKILEKYGYTYSTVPLKKMFHLKSGVNYIGDNTLLVAGEFITDSRFQDYDKIIISESEMYAANCIRINEHVIMPENFPITKKQLQQKGFSVKEVPMSEFMKIDGGLSCLSLRF